MSKKLTCALLLAAVGSAVVTNTKAAQFALTIDGSDAIFLAGRTDVLPIPPLDGNENAFILKRHQFITPEAILETLPPSIPVVGGDAVKVSDPGLGGVAFFLLPNTTAYGPEGNNAESVLSSLDGISGYHGPQGALTGVFLDDSIPSAGPAPATTDFWNMSRDFASYSPVLGEVFYIGDGETSLNALQEFIAPAGATRLFLGIPDGGGFFGVPGYYEDNDGAYRITLGVNEDPSQVPDGGSTALLALLGMAGLRFFKR